VGDASAEGERTPAFRCSPTRQAPTTALSEREEFVSSRRYGIGLVGPRTGGSSEHAFLLVPGQEEPAPNAVVLGVFLVAP
jgi:hypothetical protein